MRWRSKHGAVPPQGPEPPVPICRSNGPFYRPAFSPRYQEKTRTENAHVHTDTQTRMNTHGETREIREKRLFERSRDDRSSSLFYETVDRVPRVFSLREYPDFVVPLIIYSTKYPKDRLPLPGRSRTPASIASNEGRTTSTFTRTDRSSDRTVNSALTS